MPCREFEERLLVYDELDADQRESVSAHLIQCQDCQSFLSALSAVDTALHAAFAHTAVSADFSNSVTQKLLSQTARYRPSLIPEMLDAIGWAAVIAILLWLTAFFVPGAEFTTPLAAAMGTALLIGGFYVAYRCYGDLRRC